AFRAEHSDHSAGGDGLIRFARETRPAAFLLGQYRVDGADQLLFLYWTDEVVFDTGHHRPAHRPGALDRRVADDWGVRQKLYQCLYRLQSADEGFLDGDY